MEMYTDKEKIAILVKAVKLLLIKDAAMSEHFGHKWPLDLSPENAVTRGNSAIRISTK